MVAAVHPTQTAAELPFARVSQVSSFSFVRRQIDETLQVIDSRFPEASRTSVIVQQHRGGGFSTHQLVGGGSVLEPVRVVLAIDGSDYIATNPETGIFGYGVSGPAAIRDFRDALADHRRVLEDEADNLGDDLLDQLTFLRAHVRV